MPLQKVPFLFICFTLYICLSDARANESILDEILSPQTQNQRISNGDCPLVLFDKSVMPPSKARDVKFNGDCFIELEDIDTNQYQIVDIRSESDFEHGRIKNAINIPLHQLAKKHFLKNKQILLVNNGLPLFEMGQFCQVLTAQGFNNIKILKGGIHNWLASGLPLANTGYLPDHYNLVELERFMMDYENGFTQVVNVKSEDTKSSRIFKDAKLISLNRDKNTLKQQLDRIANERANKFQQIVVMLDEDDYLHTKYLLDEHILKDIYFLVGDKAKLEKFNRTRKAVNKARLDGPRAAQCGT